MAHPSHIVVEPISSKSILNPIFMPPFGTPKLKVTFGRVSGRCFGLGTQEKPLRRIRAIENLCHSSGFNLCTNFFVIIWLLMKIFMVVYEADGETGVGSLDIPVLSGSEVAERLRGFRKSRSGNQNYLAMYSSIVGGITTDPAAMVIPMDDHMVHRGHGVFDTAAIMDGHLYELDQHLDRFLRSASMAKLSLPFDRSTIRSILIQTVSASKCTQGSLRYWLSAGPGNFLLSPSGCPHPVLYAIVMHTPSLPHFKGIRVITSSIPMKSPQFAIMKSVNYLPNVLSKMEAEENEAFAAIWLDDNGYVAEGPNMNVGFVMTNKELVVPRFEKILSGCTSKRVLELAEKLLEEGKISGINVRDVTVNEGKMADEMMLIGSGILVKPVLRWDDHIIGNGEGPVTKLLFDLIVSDMKSGPSTVRVPVPY